MRFRKVCFVGGQSSVVGRFESITYGPLPAIFDPSLSINSCLYVLFSCMIRYFFSFFSILPPLSVRQCIDFIS